MQRAFLPQMKLLVGTSIWTQRSAFRGQRNPHRAPLEKKMLESTVSSITFQLPRLNSIFQNVSIVASIVEGSEIKTE